MMRERRKGSAARSEVEAAAENSGDGKAEGMEHRVEKWNDGGAEQDFAADTRGLTQTTTWDSIAG